MGTKSAFPEVGVSPWLQFLGNLYSTLPPGVGEMKETVPVPGWLCEGLFYNSLPKSTIPRLGRDVCVCVFALRTAREDMRYAAKRTYRHTPTHTSHTSGRADVNVLLLKFAEFITNCPSHAGTQARSCLLGGTGLTHMLKDNLKWVAHVLACSACAVLS